MTESRFRRRYVSRPLKDIAAAFHDIMEVACRHHLRLPAELVQLAKVTAMAEATALRLDPDFEILSLALPQVHRFWLRRAAAGSPVLAPLALTAGSGAPPHRIARRPR